MIHAPFPLFPKNAAQHCDSLNTMDTLPIRAGRGSNFIEKVDSWLIKKLEDSPNGANGGGQNEE
jgi:hypothetical protein